MARKFSDLFGNAAMSGKKKSPAGKPVGWGVLKPGYTPPRKKSPSIKVGEAFDKNYFRPQTSIVVGPKGGRNVRSLQPSGGGDTGGGGGGAGGGGGDGGYGAARAAARSASKKQNDNTSALVDQQKSLIDSFGKQRDIKLRNISGAFDTSDDLLLKNYGLALGGLEGTRLQNEMAEGDQSFSNIANAVRERQNIADQAASQGAGETDLLRSQLAAFRNYAANQGEVNRSFNDTLQSINNSITSLNSDTSTSRTNLFNQSEADREQAWANYANQTSDAWTQIANIENANTNVDSDTSIGYNKKFTDAGAKAAAAVENSYSRKAVPKGWTEWSGKKTGEKRALTSSNRAAAVNLGGPVKRAEGATLRKWDQ